MEFVNPYLKNEYQKLVASFSNRHLLFCGCVISIIDVLDAYFSIIEYFLENFEGRKSICDIGFICKGRLSSAVAMQEVGYPKNLKWNTDYEKCAALYYGLIKNLPFKNYNKRTALLTALYYITKIKRTSTAHHKELEVITRIIASNTIRDRKAFEQYSKFEYGEIRFLANYFQKNTQPIDNSTYVITYTELNKLLPAFGFLLNNPHGNSIEIIRTEERSSLFGLKEKRKRYKKIGIIDFPGWAREVSDKEMKLLREYTGFSEKVGIDDWKAYTGTSPLSSLINKYSDVLQQLA